MIGKAGNKLGAATVAAGAGVSSVASPEAALRARTGLQMRLAQLSQSVDGEGDQKMLAWIGRYAERFAALWDQNEGFRDAVVKRWDTDPAWCVTELRRHWRGDGP